MARCLRKDFRRVAGPSGSDLRRTNPNPSSYMNSIVYIVGAVVIVVVILKVLGLF